MMTNEERALPKLTQCCLLTLPNWNVWDAACDKQLDAHHTAGAFLKPISLPTTNAWCSSEYLANALDLQCKGQWDLKSLHNHGWLQTSCTLVM